nr:MAG TPA: hypothetical protein [Caudoviricetes sp.]
MHTAIIRSGIKLIDKDISLLDLIIFPTRVGLSLSFIYLT